jgi:hypothetical protein
VVGISAFLWRKPWQVHVEGRSGGEGYGKSGTSCHRSDGEGGPTLEKAVTDRRRNKDGGRRATVLARGGVADWRAQGRRGE